MAEIKPIKVADKGRGLTKRELYATVCYFYPQYKLTEVASLPARDVQLLLKIAQRQEASRMFNLTEIAAAPHSKKQVNVKKLRDYFKKASTGK